MVRPLDASRLSFSTSVYAVEESNPLERQVFISKIQNNNVQQATTEAAASSKQQQPTTTGGGGAEPEVGSSRKRTEGSVIISMPMLTRFL